jgi:dienelactone hydrolase
MSGAFTEAVRIPPAMLCGVLEAPEHPRGVVVFAHGSGSSRHSPRNRQVAAALRERGLATLLFDLLSEREAGSRANVFDVGLLADRLVSATDWLLRATPLGAKPFGLFGASTGAAAALVAAGRRECRASAVVSRGGRPDLAGVALSRVRAPTLLIVGSHDYAVLERNRQALAQLACEKQLAVVEGATHLFDEPGALERVAAEWFGAHLHGAEEDSDVR